jgi:hypothetical protein
MRLSVLPNANEQIHGASKWIPSVSFGDDDNVFRAFLKGPNKQKELNGDVIDAVNYLINMVKIN